MGTGAVPLMQTPSRTCEGGADPWSRGKGGGRQRPSRTGAEELAGSYLCSLPCSLPPDVRRYELILAKSAKQYAMCPLIDFINHSSSVEVTGQWPL